MLRHPVQCKCGASFFCVVWKPEWIGLNAKSRFCVCSPRDLLRNNQIRIIENIYILNFEGTVAENCRSFMNRLWYKYRVFSIASVSPLKETHFKAEMKGIIWAQKLSSIFGTSCGTTLVASARLCVFMLIIFELRKRVNLEKNNEFRTVYIASLPDNCCYMTAI